MNTCAEIERSIQKKYRKTIWNEFIGGLKNYRMIAAGDKIAVCVSGGKDSMLLAKCMQELQRHGSDVPFSLEYIALDPGYTPETRQRLEQNAAWLELPLTFYEDRIFSVVERNSADAPCYLCARMRRGALYSFAQSLGCNKIALGHHFDDVIETTLMSLFYEAEMRTMMPKLHSTHFPGMELIRPLYQVRERDILAWERYNGLTFQRCACSVTSADAASAGSKRAEVKHLIAALRKTNPQIDVNIFRAAQNVNLETLIGYRKNGVFTDFLADYEKIVDKSE